MKTTAASSTRRTAVSTTESKSTSRLASCWVRIRRALPDRHLPAHRPTGEETIEEVGERVLEVVLGHAVEHIKWIGFLVVLLVHLDLNGFLLDRLLIEELEEPLALAFPSPLGRRVGRLGRVVPLIARVV